MFEQRTENLQRKDLMNKIILQCAISKDGFIARENGDFDFLTMPSDEAFHTYFNHFLKQIDVIVMGYKTYHIMKQMGPLPFENISKIVFTKRHISDQDEFVTFTDQPIENFVKNNQKKVWLFGGANLFTQFLELDCIGEIHLYQEQVTIGSGIPVFITDGWEKLYKSPEVTHYKQGSLLIYKKEQ